MSWQPIKTAPKDGSVILLFIPIAKVKVTGGYWDKDLQQKYGIDGGWVAGGYIRATNPPTHWMPLPDPPTHWMPLPDPPHAAN